MRTLGHGHSGIEKLTTLLSMPKPITRNNYDKIVTALVSATKEVAKETMLDAVKDIREEKTGDEHEVVNTGVSVDGSWQKRGYSSHNGVVTAISIDNSKIIDVEPMSKLCKACIIMKDKLKGDPLAYAEWQNSHTCKFNYSGSAGGMEAVGTERIFKRSISNYSLRYTQMLGDGDSKSYDTIRNIYEGVEVEKLDCIEHFQKRIGTRCRNLKKKTKGLGGRGRLTKAIIDRLQNYFGIAIRQNVGNLSGMKSSALGSLFHVASSKSSSYHFPHCPVGKDSWCKFNRDKANQTNEYKAGPGLPLDIIMALKPIYQNLTKDSYLKRLLHGKTQNQNESFNAMIWDRIPKTKYVALPQLELGVYDAICAFNIGLKSTVLIFQKLGMIPGYFLVKGYQSLNDKRISLSTYKNREKNKQRRKFLRGRKNKKEDKIEEVEGKLYEAGAFD